MENGLCLDNNIAINPTLWLHMHNLRANSIFYTKVHLVRRADLDFEMQYYVIPVSHLGGKPYAKINCLAYSTVCSKEAWLC